MVVAMEDDSAPAVRSRRGGAPDQPAMPVAEAPDRRITTRNRPPRAELARRLASVSASASWMRPANEGAVAIAGKGIRGRAGPVGRREGEPDDAGRVVAAHGAPRPVDAPPRAGTPSWLPGTSVTSGVPSAEPEAGAGDLAGRPILMRSPVTATYRRAPQVLGDGRVWPIITRPLPLPVGVAGQARRRARAAHVGQGARCGGEMWASVNIDTGVAPRAAMVGCAGCHRRNIAGGVSWRATRESPSGECA